MHAVDLRSVMFLRSAIDTRKINKAADHWYITTKNIKVWVEFITNAIELEYTPTMDF